MGFSPEEQIAKKSEEVLAIHSPSIPTFANKTTRYDGFCLTSPKLIEANKSVIRKEG